MDTKSPDLAGRVAAAGIPLNRLARETRIPRETLRRKLDLGIGVFTLSELHRLGRVARFDVLTLVRVYLREAGW